MTVAHSAIPPQIPLTLGTLVGILLGLGLSIGVVLAVGALCYFQLSAAWRNQGRNSIENEFGPKNHFSFYFDTLA